MHQLFPIYDQKPFLMLKIRALTLLKIVYTYTTNYKKHTHHHCKINTFFAPLVESKKQQRRHGRGVE